MTSEPAEAAPPSWLDRWLEPPWRALLTWVLLAAVMNFALMCGGVKHSIRINTFLVGSLHEVIAGQPSPYLAHLVGISNSAVLLLWYQPILLRLDLLRWVIWMGIAAAWANVVAVRIDYWSIVPIDETSLQLWVWPMLSGSLLVGYRSWPWMSFPAGVLSLVFGNWLYHHPFGFGRMWWWLPVSSFPYAALMLYGTRRLPRKAGG